MAKHIFVTGGVVSSLGKGLTSGSIGMLLESRGLRVGIQKMDPYINVDPGTMSPYEHGEVYVTEDGAETDLDLGHYERFTNARIRRDCNYTTGRIYGSVIQKEREGKYLGKTVQVVPHITNEIKEAIRGTAQGVDVLITEIGGTVGDIEGLPFLEAIRELALDIGRENVLYVHLTLLPFLHASGEIKSKPTQHSVGKLREIGIQPDILICRTEKTLEEDLRAKLSLFCNVPREAVIEERDVEFSIYEVPIILQAQKLDDLIVKKLGLPAGSSNVERWRQIVEVIKNPKATVEIAVVGKYLEHGDAYKSVFEAMTHGGIANQAKVKLRKVHSEDVEEKGAAALLKGAQGVLVPGGFGIRGTEGKVEAIQWARVNRVPFLGLCLGMQCASIEFARNVVGLKGANSSEFDPATPHPVIDLMEGQRGVNRKGGTMRLGAYPCRVKPGTRAFAAYGKDAVTERHRHRFEFNNKYRDEFARSGFVFSGIYPEGDLVEIVEVADHPWFVATQFHPEFQSKPTEAHPLFRAFVAAAMATRPS